MNIPINIWYYDELLDTWIVKPTSHFQETKDEYKYFRVLCNGKKYFYSSGQDYIKHNENNIKLEFYKEDNNVIFYITDVNNNKLKFE